MNKEYCYFRDNRSSFFQHKNQGYRVVLFLYLPSQLNIGPWDWGAVERDKLKRVGIERNNLNTVGTERDNVNNIGIKRNNAKNVGIEKHYAKNVRIERDKVKNVGIEEFM